MEFKEYNGKNVDEAVTKACVDLGVPTEKLQYEVIRDLNMMRLPLLMKTLIS